MNRRSFLSSSAAVFGGFALDPDRLLWRQGAKLISIPKPHPISTASGFAGAFSVGDIITFHGDPTRYVVTAVNPDERTFLRFAPTKDYYKNLARAFMGEAR